MQQINGKIAFGGIAIGKIKEVFKENNVVRRVKIDDTQAEISRFRVKKERIANGKRNDRSRQKKRNPVYDT